MGRDLSVALQNARPFVSQSDAAKYRRFSVGGAVFSPNTPLKGNYVETRRSTRSEGASDTCLPQSKGRKSCSIPSDTRTPPSFIRDVKIGRASCRESVCR